MNITYFGINNIVPHETAKVIPEQNNLHTYKDIEKKKLPFPNFFAPFTAAWDQKVEDPKSSVRSGIVSPGLGFFFYEDRTFGHFSISIYGIFQSVFLG